MICSINHSVCQYVATHIITLAYIQQFDHTSVPNTYFAPKKRLFYLPLGKPTPRAKLESGARGHVRHASEPKLGPSRLASSQLATTLCATAISTRLTGGIRSYSQSVVNKSHAIAASHNSARNSTASSASSSCCCSPPLLLLSSSSPSSSSRCYCVSWGGAGLRPRSTRRS